jgi:hypothetical protein
MRGAGEGGGPVLLSELLNLSLDGRHEALLAGERLEHHSEVFRAESVEGRGEEETEARGEERDPCCTSWP